MRNYLLITFVLILLTLVGYGQTQKIENWPNGQKKVSGSYKYAVPVSASASKEDLLKSSSQIIKVGKWQYWFENGQLQAEENYTDGTRTGVQKSWYSDGKHESEIDLNGLKAFYWFANGQKQSEGSILNNGTPVGLWVAWHENGVKNSEGAYDPAGKKQGTWKFWDDKGQLIGQQNYVNGVLH
jgi:antitoxin component YwqK of YwqJK toxin-antitoxin module